MNDPVTLKSGLTMPAIGIGTWRMGENPSVESDEVDAILHAIDSGITHLDTAEMYGDGATEDLLGRALAQRRREDLFLTSKVYPWNADTRDMIEACEGSLTRLGTDYLDLYLLHWPGSVPFEQTLAGAERLIADGKIRAFGISNFDTSGLGRIIDAGQDRLIDVNQVMYNPARRGIEYDLLPLMKANRIACVAYTPIEPARLSGNADFRALAGRLGLTPAQLALAWHVTRNVATPIPKASSVAHVDELIEAAGIRLEQAVLEEVDHILPPPSRPQRLDII